MRGCDGTRSCGRRAAAGEAGAAYEPDALIERSLYLGARTEIRFATVGARERVVGGAAAEAAEGPCGVTAHERLRVGERCCERRHRVAIAAVAERDGDVAEKAGALGTRHRGAAEARAKPVRIEREESRQMRRERVVRLRFGGGVPGARLLADVAA